MSVGKALLQFRTSRFFVWAWIGLVRLGLWDLSSERLWHWQRFILLWRGIFVSLQLRERVLSRSERFVVLCSCRTVGLGGEWGYLGLLGWFDRMLAVRPPLKKCLNALLPALPLKDRMLFMLFTEDKSRLHHSRSSHWLAYVVILVILNLLSLIRIWGFWLAFSWNRG